MLAGLPASSRRWFLVCADIGAAGITALWATALAGIVSEMRRPPALASAAVAAAVAAILGLSLHAVDLYDWRLAFEDARAGSRLPKAIGGAAIFLALLVSTWPRPSLLPLRLLPCAFAGGALAIALLRSSLLRIDAFLELRTRVFLVGEGAAAGAFRDAVREHGAWEIVGMVGSASSELAEQAVAAGAGVLVVAVDERRGVPTQELLRCRLLGLPVVDFAEFAERELGRIPVDLLHPSDIIFGDGFSRSPVREWLRRAFAVVIGVGLSVLTAPLQLAIAAAVKLDSHGPVLYRQVRVGQAGRSFVMLKFRTMTTDAEREGARWAGCGDSRVTRVGRVLRQFRLDELPQLVNVLRGEMGLVGPRPERPEFVADLRRRIPYYDLRSLVPPGITGWAQVRFPYAASLQEAKEKLQYDLFYVKHLSIRLDLVILLASIKVVLLGRGAR